MDTLFPSESDDSQLDWWQLAGLGSLYVLAALVEERGNLVVNMDSIVPQSEEVHADTREVHVGLNEQEAQNVTFVDTHPGYCIHEKKYNRPIERSCITK